MMPVSAIILAGGQSRRMGINKALLPLDGQPLIAHTAACLRPLAAELIVVTNTPQTYAFLETTFGARLIPDALPVRSALVGLFSGLQAVRSELALAVACDMPFLNVDLLRFMLTLAQEGFDVAVPQVDGQFEPLHAVYRPAACVPVIERHLRAGDQRIISFYSAVRVRPVTAVELVQFDPQRLSLVNVNTPEEWKEWQTFSNASRR